MKHIYVCGCTAGGGVYHYVPEGEGLSLREVLPLDRPMYMTTQGHKAYIILRETDAHTHCGGLLTCDIAADGSLVPQAGVESTQGIVPCHVSAREGEVYITNYLSGSIIRMPDVVRTHVGHGPHAQRQDMAHTHCSMVTPDGAEVLCTDLGRDVIAVYDRALRLQYEVCMPCGCGPRHLAMAEDGKHLLCINELACSLTLLARNAGRWRCVHTVPLTDHVTERDTAAAIRVQGSHLYASLRGADLIISLRMDGKGLHRLQAVACGGQSPRDIFPDGDTLYSANEGSGTVTALHLRPGGMGPARVVAEVPGALCICTLER